MLGYFKPSSERVTDLSPASRVPPNGAASADAPAVVLSACGF